MKEQFLHDKQMFDFGAGIYCGVYLPTHVMKKIAILAAQYSTDIKKLLNEHADELLPADWTLANKLDEDGKIVKQVTIKYAKKLNGRSEVESRIKLFQPPQPIHIKELYVVENHEQAREIAQEVLLEELARSAIDSTESA